MTSEDFYYFLPYILGFIVLVWYFRKRVEAGRKIERRWRMFADERGLVEQGGGFLEFHGESHGMHFILDAHTVKTGDSYKTYTRMRIQVPGLPEGFGIRRETGFDRLGKKLGLADIQIGDSEFDKSFIIKGADEEKVKTYLNQERRHALIRYLDELESFEIKDGFLAVEKPYMIENLPEMDMLFSKAGDLAQSLVGG